MIGALERLDHLELTAEQKQQVLSTSIGTPYFATSATAINPPTTATAIKMTANYELLSHRELRQKISNRQIKLRQDKQQHKTRADSSVTDT